MDRTPSESRPPRLRRRSSLLRQGVIRAVLAANVLRPVRNSPVLTVPSFFASWLVGETAPSVLGVWAARTWASVRRSRRSGGLTGGDILGVGLTAGAAVGLAASMRPAAEADGELRGSLSHLIPTEELDARPRAPRLAALTPLAFGGGKRRCVRNVTYSTVAGVDLKLDVYEPLDAPAPGERRPAVLQIHGGAWVVGSKDEQGIPLLNHLAANGWVGFNINYRLSPRAKFPFHLHDCKRALAWIREHADDYGIDPDFVVVTGGSAGGHLTALMALTANDPAFQEGFEDADTGVQAAVPFYGVYDLLDRERDYVGYFLPMLERLVMGTNPQNEPANWEAYSPIDRIHDDAPPMMVLHGTSDVLVPLAGARRFVEKLAATSQNPVAYAELTGAQHAFDILPSIRCRHTIEYVERFLHHMHTDYLTAADPHEHADHDAPPMEPRPTDMPDEADLPGETGQPGGSGLPGGDGLGSESEVSPDDAGVR